MSDEIIRAGKPLPKIKDAKPLDGRKISVVWESGEVKIVDLAPALTSRRIYIPLRDDDELFRSFVISEYGDAIEWPNGIDFSALWIDRLPPAGMANAEFRSIMDRLGLSLDGMAASLDVSRRLVADYRANKRIPSHIALATRYLASLSGKDAAE
jgi:DNA-binding transcriptional regulator YiaG